MKKGLFLIITLTFILISCNNESPPELNFTETDLNGTWNLKALHTENGTFSSTLNGLPISGDASVLGSNFNAQANFTTNPNKVTPTGNFSLEVTATVAGTSQSFDQEIEEIPNLSGDWSVENNTIIISNNNIQNTFQIINFNNNTLELQSTFDQDFDFQGVNTNITGDLFLTLEK